MPCDVLGELDDVVDPGRVVALRGEHLGAGVEELAHRALSAGPQLTGAGRGRPTSGGRVGSAGARAAGGSLRAGHGVRVGGPDAGVTFRPLGLTGPGLRRYALTPMSGRPGRRTEQESASATDVTYATIR